MTPFIVVTERSGRKLYVNPSHVCTMERTDASLTYLVLATGEPAYVVETPEVILHLIDPSLSPLQGPPS